MSFNYRSQMRTGDVHSMMTDPSMANSRIYVGNIPMNDISKRDLEDRFEKYGNILGISLYRGYGFVQFEHDKSAVEAIEQENGATFCGNPMEVNAARVFGGNRPRGDAPPARWGGDTDERENFRDRSPIDDRSRDRDWRDRGSFYHKASDFKKEPAPFSGLDKFRSEERTTSFSKEPFGTNSFRSGTTENQSRVIQDRTNDCEIIVFNKAQREYAEYIERRLKVLGLSVDVLFPNEEVPISRILANISSHGTLYAIVVMPQNEEHRSLTLNILHGLPQEHRNMPIEDAVALIKRNYDAFKGVPAVTRHPDPMQALITLLYENRPLTVLQYDRIIAYLQEKRELQLKVELGDAKDFVPSSKEPATKQQVELQHRILNILNNQQPSSTAVPAPVAPPSGMWQQPSSTPLLSDPNVQKALDSLMQGNLLRKIGSGTNPTTTASQLGTPPSQPSFGGWGGAGKMM